MISLRTFGFLGLVILFGQVGFTQNNSDPFSNQQWWHKNTGLSQRIELDPIIFYEVQGRKNQDIQLTSKKMPGKKIRVAVLDTGIDLSHPDLKGVIRRNEKECAPLEKYKACLNAATSDDETNACDLKWLDLKNPEVDQDHNGYPLDCNGWSVFPNKVSSSGVLGGPIVDDEAGHGTHVAGVIGAAFNNLGVHGVSQNVEILPIKVIGGSPKEPIKPLQLQNILDPKEDGKPSIKPNSFLGDLVARGMIYAINNGAQVINLSLGWADTADSTYFREAVKLAQTKGIFVVAAAGNDSTRALIRPCSYEGVICVGAHGPDGSLSHFSNYGSGVDIAAPGTNILSTYPTQLRAIRFRTTEGYEFIHGTSQASPIVAGVIAEMLAQGVPNDEIYPRLILGARPLEEKLPLLAGAPQDLQLDKLSISDASEKKWILSGQLDYSRSMNVKPEPLILPIKKERTEILWNQKSDTFKVSIVLKNHTTPVETANVSVSAKFKVASKSSITPQVIGIKSLGAGLWKKGESREFEVTLKITDASPQKTRINSDLDLIVSTVVSGKAQRDYVQEFELVTPIAQAQSEKIPLNAEFSPDAIWIPFDKILDQKNKTDYLVTEKIEGVFKATLVSQDSTGAYVAKGSIEEPYEIDTEDFIVQTQARAFDSITKRNFYAIAIIKTSATDGEDPAPVEMSIYQKDLNFKDIETFKIDAKKIGLPKNIYWMKVGQQLRPAWYGLGYDLQRKWTLIELWNKDNLNEEPEPRLYYFDKSQNIQGIKNWESQSIIDVLNQSPLDTASGTLTLLTAVNNGDSIVASYVTDFRIFKISDLKTQSQTKLTQFEKGGPVYRNFKASEPELVLSLDPGVPNSNGNVWVNRSSQRTLQMTVAQLTPHGLRRYDQRILAARGSVDSPLAMQAAYLGVNTAEAFVLTNSEIQFHDLIKSKVLTKSLERYSFFGNGQIKVHFPIVVADSKSSVKLPGIYIPDGISIVNNLKIRTILRDKSGQGVEIVTPARFRIKPDGCESIKGVVQDSAGNPALDFICQKTINRIRLVY